MREEKVKERMERCVCRRCGSKLAAKVVIYNKYGGSGLELCCPACEKIEYGTEPEIYRLAKDFVNRVEFDYFVDMEPGEENTKMNIAKMCDILSWNLKKLGVMDGNGIKDNPVCDFFYEDTEEY